MSVGQAFRSLLAALLAAHNAGGAADAACAGGVGGAAAGADVRLAAAAMAGTLAIAWHWDASLKKATTDAEAALIWREWGERREAGCQGRPAAAASPPRPAASPRLPGLGLPH